MFDTKAFKQAVLQQAMQGKLTQQLPEDGNASDLLQAIDKEKQRLISEGKIKKQKALPDIGSDEVPFEIPNSWEWVRLGEITNVKSGKRVPKGMKLEDDFKDGSSKYLRVTNMKNNSVDEDDIKYANKAIVDKIDNYRIYNTDVYITVAGTIGRVGIIPKHLNGILLTENANRLTPLKYNNFFLLYLLLSPLITHQIYSLTNKVAQPKLSIKSIKSLIIPLPPLAEQQRIVSHIDKCCKLADSIDEEHELNLNFSTNMRTSLLNAAMKGKLTQQLPEDGNASELLRSIDNEKQRLIKEGEIKKQKPLPDIDPDDIPFEIPDNWKWARLGDITDIIMGQSPKGKDVTDSNDNSNIEFHQGKTFFGDKILKQSNKYTSNFSRVVDSDYILMSVRAPVGDINIVNRKIALGRGLCGISPICIDKIYLYYYLLTQKNNLMQKSTGSTFKAVNKMTIFNIIVPIPPFAEQKRIIIKLDYFFSKLCKIL